MELNEELDRLTDPDGNLRRVDELAYLEDGTLVVVLSGSVGETGTRLFHVSPGTTELLPLGALEEVDGLWPAGDRVLISADGRLCLVDLEGRRSEVTVVPEDTGSVDASWTKSGLRAGAILHPAADDDDQIEIYPKARGTVALLTYAPDEGWVERAQIPSGCNGLTISRDGRRLAWREPVNVVPEEAMRGEFRGYDCDRDELVCFTENAGKARQIIVHPAGGGVAYVANFSQDRPITTHTDLWWQGWNSGERVNLTGGGRSIDGVGWCPDGSSVWVSIMDGTCRVTQVVGLDGQQQQSAWPAQHGGATSDIAWRGVEPAFETESASQYPRIQVGAKSVTIPQPEAFDDIRCTIHQWTASDGLQVQGVIWDLAGTPGDAPLLVRAHGGPAGEVEAVRSEGVRFRYLLHAGYRLFIPAFRGSLGFGDTFLGANIGCQGVGDLDDIVTGIDHLAQHGLADPARVGIFGGSYGGYMTLRALAVSDRFAAGVALYGFLDNRWMTLETGDFTYEDEYIAPVAWPRTEASLVSDVFSHLGQIDSPLLMLHGDQDPICPWSHSMVAFRALEARGVTTGLVIYPGEGHGFRQKEHQRDAARRTLTWFLQHLSPSPNGQESQ